MTGPWHPHPETLAKPQTLTTRSKGVASLWTRLTLSADLHTRSRWKYELL